MLFAILLARCVVAATAVGLDEVILTSSLVDSINRLNTTWQASTEQGSFFKGATLRQVTALMGVRKSDKAPVPPRACRHTRKDPILHPKISAR